MPRRLTTEEFITRAKKVHGDTYDYSKDFDHNKFWQWCRDRKSEGHQIFISEYQAPDDFTCIWEKEVTNSMNTTKTYKPVEKLFTV